MESWILKQNIFPRGFYRKFSKTFHKLLHGTPEIISSTFLLTEDDCKNYIFN